MDTGLDVPGAGGSYGVGARNNQRASKLPHDPGKCRWVGRSHKIGKRVGGDHGDAGMTRRASSAQGDPCGASLGCSTGEAVLVHRVDVHLDLLCECFDAAVVATARGVPIAILASRRLAVDNGFYEMALKVATGCPSRSLSNSLAHFRQ